MKEINKFKEENLPTKAYSLWLEFLFIVVVQRIKHRLKSRLFLQMHLYKNYALCNLLDKELQKQNEEKVRYYVIKK